MFPPEIGDTTKCDKKSPWDKDKDNDAMPAAADDDDVDYNEVGEESSPTTMKEEEEDNVQSEY